MSRPIFRKEALDRLASPEQLDQLLQLTSPRGWIALAALGLLLLFALAWGFLGTITTTVEGQGILRRSGGPVRLEAPAAGVVRYRNVQLGSSVAEGQVLMMLTPDGPGKQEPIPLRSPVAARVLGGSVKSGASVKKGAPLLLLDPERRPMHALLYVPVGVGYQVQPGMKVLVSPAPASKSEFGYLRGEVVSAAKFPSTRDDMAAFLENEDMVRHLSAAGPCLQIFVKLDPDPDTPSGYRWTSARGWPLALYSGIPCQALITVREQRPVELVMPALKDLLGL
jgi:hypothetical protein